MAGDRGEGDEVMRGWRSEEKGVRGGREDRPMVWRGRNMGDRGEEVRGHLKGDEVKRGMRRRREWRMVNGLEGLSLLMETWGRGIKRSRDRGEGDEVKRG